MKYPTTLIIAALFCRTAVAAPEPVTCDSPCDCHNAHGEGRWSVKTDPSLPPTDASAIQAVTPSEMFGWPGPDAALTMQSERTGIENKWYALKGRVVELKVEEDGDPFFSPPLEPVYWRRKSGSKWIREWAIAST
jgi:hypothetical protein